MTGSSIDWSETARDAIRAHELLVSRQGSLDELPLRPLVRDSWKRTLLHAGPPAEPTVLRGENLDLVRERSELHRIWPVFERLLVPAAGGVGSYPMGARGGPEAWGYLCIGG